MDMQWAWPTHGIDGGSFRRSFRLLCSVRWCGSFVVAMSRATDDPERDQAMLRAYRDEGASVRDLAERFSLSATRIRQILSGFGVTFQGRPGDPERDQAMLRAYRDEGASVRDLAERFSLSATRIRQILSGFGVTFQGRPGDPERDQAMLRAYRDEGASVRDLAERFSLSEMSIRRILSKLGVVFEGRGVFKERNRGMLTAFESGTTVQQLAEQHSITVPRVHQILNAAGRPKRGRPQRDPVNHLQNVLAEIASEQSPSEPTVDYEEVRSLKGDERGKVIRDLYEGGLTLQEIGDIFGVTRERVRQINLKYGGSAAEISIEKRTSDRDSALQGKADRFVDEYRNAIHSLADEGLSRSDIEARFNLLEPSIESEVVRRGFDKVQAEFNINIQDLAFSDEVLAETVWLFTGLNHSSLASPAESLLLLDTSGALELSQTLISASVDRETIAAFLRISSGAKAQNESDGLVLTRKEYANTRRELQAHFGWTSGKGSATWPPTSQTIQKRLGEGYWADAMHSLEISPGDRGRPRGLLKFTDEDYLDAVATFVAHAGRSGITATFSGYGEWVLEEERAGRVHPSSAAVRIFFGNWLNARRAARSLQVATAQVKGSEASKADVAPSCLVRAESELHSFLSELVGLGRNDASIAVRDFIRNYVEEFEIARRGWIRRMVEFDDSALPRQLASTSLSTKHRRKLESGETVRSFLSDRYLDDELRGGDPRQLDGWIAPSAQLEIDQLDDTVITRFQVMRELRNFFTHQSVEAGSRLADVVSKLPASERSARVENEPTSRLVFDWLLASDGRRFRSISASIPEIWRAKVVAEAKVGT